MRFSAVLTALVLAAPTVVLSAPFSSVRGGESTPNVHVHDDVSAASLTLRDAIENRCVLVLPLSNCDGITDTTRLLDTAL